MHLERELCFYLLNSKLFNTFSNILKFYSSINDHSFKTSEKQYLHIKLNWYKEALISTDKTGVKEVDNLKDIILQYNLSTNDFLKFINAKYTDLNTFPFANYNEIINYAENTEGIIFKNIGLINNLSNNEINNINNIAIAYSLIGIIRNFVFYYKNKNIYNLFFNYPEVLDNFEENLQNKVKTIIELAIGYINKSKNIKNTSKKYKKFLLFNNITLNYINNIKNSNYNLFTADLYNINKLTYVKILFKNIFIK